MKYNVYLVSQTFAAEYSESKRFVGTTYAVSAAKAACNVSYRTGRPVWKSYDLGRDTELVEELIAEEAPA